MHLGETLGIALQQRSKTTTVLRGKYDALVANAVISAEELELATTDLPARLNEPRRFSWVVGHLVAEALEPVVARLNAVEGLELMLYGLPSPYWGQDQVVTGLLTGSDLLAGLAGQDLGDSLLLPSVMLRQGEPVFLDDLTLAELEQRLPVPIQLLQGADDLVAVCTRQQSNAD